MFIRFVTMPSSPKYREASGWSELGSPGTDLEVEKPEVVDREVAQPCSHSAATGDKLLSRKLRRDVEPEGGVSSILQSFNRSRLV